MDAISIAKFWSSVDVKRDCECWVWRGAANERGYGRYADTMAHRVAYTLIKGEIPEGALVRHVCDNPPCCNPKHLLIGSHSDNSKDAIDRRRIAWGERNHNTRITEEDAVYIRKNPDKLTGKALAAKFGMSPSSISYIRSGHTWKYAGETKADS